MIKLAKTSSLKNLFLSAALFILGIANAVAQETSKLDVDVNLGGAKSNVWYTQTWVWIVGGLVFILLLVALLRGGNNNRA